MSEYRRIRRYLELSQRDVSLGTSIPIGRIAAAEQGRTRLTRPEERALREFLENRLRILHRSVGELRVPSEILVRDG